MAWGIPESNRSIPWQGAPTPTPIAPLRPSPEEQGLQNALNLYTGFQGPNLAQNTLTQGRLAGQLGYTDAQFGLDTNQLNQQAGFDRSRIGLSREGVGVDRASLDRQIGVNSQLQNLANQLLGLNKTELGKDYNTSQRKLLSNATARGAVSFGQGFADDRADIYGKLLLDTQRGDVEQKKSDINYSENKAQLEDRKKQVDLRAKGLGIDAAELESRLSSGLQKLGVDRFFRWQDIMDAMQSNDLQRRAIAEQIYQQALEAFNTMPGAFIPPIPPFDPAKWQGGGGGDVTSGKSGITGSW